MRLVPRPTGKSVSPSTKRIWHLLSHFGKFPHLLSTLKSQNLLWSDDLRPERRSTSKSPKQDNMSNHRQWRLKVSQVSWKLLPTLSQESKWYPKNLPWIFVQIFEFPLNFLSQVAVSDLNPGGQHRQWLNLLTCYASIQLCVLFNNISIFNVATDNLAWTSALDWLLIWNLCNVHPLLWDNTSASSHKWNATSSYLQPIVFWSLTPPLCGLTLRSLFHLLASAALPSCITITTVATIQIWISTCIVLLHKLHHFHLAWTKM